MSIMDVALMPVTATMAGVRLMWGVMTGWLFPSFPPPPRKRGRPRKKP